MCHDYVEKMDLTALSTSVQIADPVSLLHGDSDFIVNGGVPSYSPQQNAELTGNTKVSGCKVALITGITGQDGSYLAELLLSKGYIVHGMVRRSSQFNTARIDHLYEDRHAGELSFFLHFADLTDTASIGTLIAKIRPTEVYNLAAMSHVRVSFDMPEYTANVDAIGALRVLDAIRICGLEKSCKFYQASSSEMYGQAPSSPQSESTAFHPRSPYGVAKVFAYWTTINYREAYGVFAVNGILFNHESPRRGPTFVTRKITRAAARISQNIQNCLYLGNLEAKRDWGHAKDYVKAMWMMMQHGIPEDFVIASGKAHSVREVCELAFSYVGMQIEWRGIRGSAEETGVDAKSGRTVIRIDPVYYRPAEVDNLLGDASKARKLLGWSPSICFESLIKEMVEQDMHLLLHGDITDGWSRKRESHAPMCSLTAASDYAPPVPSKDEEVIATKSLEEDE